MVSRTFPRAALNGMETTISLVAWTLAAIAFVRCRVAADARSAVVLGVTLGLAFWARNDAVVLCGALGMLMLAPHVERVLGSSLRSAETTRRWVEAELELLTRPTFTAVDVTADPTEE